MKLFKDLLRGRNYEWMGELKALRVLSEFSTTVSSHALLREFKDAITPKFYKSGILFVSAEHPTIAYRVNQCKEVLVADMNIRLKGEANVQEIFVIS